MGVLFPRHEVIAAPHRAMERSGLGDASPGRDDRCNKNAPSEQSFGSLSRREFLSFLAGVTSLRLSPSLEDDLASVLDEPRRLVSPERGESLPIEDTLLQRDLILRGPCEGENALFLTFDDGPLFCTGRILDLLDVTRHRATFFIIGRNLGHPKLRAFAMRALRSGHNLANHSYTHPDFSTISAKRAVKEVVETHAAIEELIAEAEVEPSGQNLFFRFPYGIAGSRSNFTACRDALAELNYRVAWWDLDTNDWRMEPGAGSRAPSRVLATLKKVRPRDVVLLHDRTRTAEHLPAMLKLLEDESLVSVALCRYDREIEQAARYSDSRTTLAQPVPSPQPESEDFLGQFVRKLETDGKRHRSSR